MPTKSTNVQSKQKVRIVNRFQNLVLIAAIAAALNPLTLLADRRNYVWTYQYQTMPAGATELEFYQTTRLLKDLDQWEYRIEVEHGLTNRWDFSVYQIFAQAETGPFYWDAVQFRTRYRIGEEGQYLMDPLVYLEYNRSLDTSEPNKVEAKVILAKTVKRVNLALNPVYELGFAPGTKHEAGLDAGLSYEFTPMFTLGMESTTRAEFKEGEREVGSYFGPTLSFASGEWWYSIGAGVGVTDESDDARVRFLMGVGL